MASIFDSYVTTATQDFIMPAVYDTVLDDNVLTARLLANPETFRWEQQKTNWRVWSANAAATLWGWFRWTDTFNTQRQDETIQGAFNPKYVYEPINLIHTDLSMNKGKEEVIDIVKRETEYGLSNLMDNVWSMFYSNATDSSKNFSGLQHIVSTSGSYWGQAKATYTVLKSWGTWAAWLDSSTTALTLASMRTVSNAVTSGSDKSTLISTTPAIFGFYEALLQPMQRMDIWGYNKVTRDGLSKWGLGGETWFDALAYDGIPLVRDEKCTDDYMYFLNEKWLKFYQVSGFWDVAGWTWINFRPDVVQGQYSINAMPGHKTWLSWSGWKEPTNQAAVTSQAVLAWELITTMPQRQGWFSAITS
jgi:hypothetical protein